MTSYQDVLDALAGTGIPFAESAWVSAPDSSYGVVQLDGAPADLWADGELICELISGTVTLICQDQGFEDKRIVQDALLSLNNLHVRLERAPYFPETNLTNWVWRIWTEV